MAPPLQRVDAPQQRAPLDWKQQQVPAVQAGGAACAAAGPAGQSSIAHRRGVRAGRIERSASRKGLPN